MKKLAFKLNRIDLFFRAIRRPGRVAGGRAGRAGGTLMPSARDATRDPIARLEEAHRFLRVKETRGDPGLECQSPSFISVEMCRVGLLS